jgi:predicted Fe-S protein YdhL (DUF1289 family)
MGEKGKLEQVYEQYKEQIETVVRVCRGNMRKAGEIIAWMYGVGTPESWRKSLGKLPIKAPKSESIKEFLEMLAKREEKE